MNILICLATLLAISHITSGFDVHTCGLNKNCLFSGPRNESSHFNTPCYPRVSNPNETNYCDFGMSYQWLPDYDGGNWIKIQLRRPRKQENTPWHNHAVYVAMGLSDDEMMGNDSVVQCIFNESSSDPNAFFLLGFSYNYNYDFHNATVNEIVRDNGLEPDENHQGDEGHNLKHIEAIVTEDMYSCTFLRRITPKFGAHIDPGNSTRHPPWDLAQEYYILMSHGGFDMERGKLLYHGKNSVVFADGKVNMPKTPYTKGGIDFATCNTEKRCFGLSNKNKDKDCDRAITDPNNDRYCIAHLTVTPQDKDNFITMELMASRPHMINLTAEDVRYYVAMGFSYDGGMVNSSVVHCTFYNERTEAYQSFNYKYGPGPHDNTNKVLPEETGKNGPNVVLLGQFLDNDFITCKVKRRVSPLTDYTNQTNEVFHVNRQFNLIMAFGQTANGTIYYHFTNKGKVSDPIDVTAPFPKAASMMSISTITSILSIAVYFTFTKI